MVDAGCGLGVEETLHNLRADGLDPQGIKTIFVTHYHVDHAGGAAEWQRLTGAQIVASRETAAALRTGDVEITGLAAAKAGGFYPPELALGPCQVAVEAADDDTFHIGALTIRAIASPGHCDGHFVYLLQGSARAYLFSGDCVFWGGTIVLQNIPDCRIAQYSSTVERLAELSFDALLPGHLAISLRDGRRHVAAAASSFKGLGLPRNAVQL
jgi:glyoxylase-like metal-dependent hydrolase (beta-lactamase superfamily II)